MVTAVAEVTAVVSSNRTTRQALFVFGGGLISPEGSSACHVGHPTRGFFLQVKRLAGFRAFLVLVVLAGVCRGLCAARQPLCVVLFLLFLCASPGLSLQGGCLYSWPAACLYASVLVSLLLESGCLYASRAGGFGSGLFFSSSRSKGADAAGFFGLHMEAVGHRMSLSRVLRSSTEAVSSSLSARRALRCADAASALQGRRAARVLLPLVRCSVALRSRVLLTAEAVSCRVVR